MKRKLCGVLLMVLMMIFVGMMSACGDALSEDNLTGDNIPKAETENNSSQKESEDNSSKIELSYGKKYIYTNSISAETGKQSYFMFKNDGTGVNYNYSIYVLNSRYFDYLINFKYLIIEDTVICFYDSMEYGADHTEGTVYSATWTAVLGFSKDVLLRSNNDMFICEDYLKNIPNFGKN